MIYCELFSCLSGYPSILSNRVSGELNEFSYLVDFLDILSYTYFITNVIKKKAIHLLPNGLLFYQQTEWSFWLFIFGVKAHKNLSIQQIVSALFLCYDY